jgi:ribonuclease P protein component
MAKQFGLGRSERLKSRKRIEQLFAAGRSFNVFPLRITFLFLPSANAGIQVGVSASKRQFKKAVHRNRLKRQLREAYRLQKTALVAAAAEKGWEGQVFLVYTAKEMLPFDTIREAVGRAIATLEKKLHERNEISA